MPVATRARNQRGEGERLRTALLDAAGELLGESQDVERPSMRAVTARAGVRPTALYLHLGDKDALTAAVRARGFEALAGVVREAEAEDDGDALAQLRIPLWMALHGRAAVRAAMPEVPNPDEERYVDPIVERSLGASRPKR